MSGEQEILAKVREHCQQAIRNADSELPRHSYLGEASSVAERAFVLLDVQVNAIDILTLLDGADV